MAVEVGVQNGSHRCILGAHPKTEPDT
jgi:hypothetical protein